jgi:hypothetical protein
MPSEIRKRIEALAGLLDDAVARDKHRLAVRLRRVLDRHRRELAAAIRPLEREVKP